MTGFRTDASTVNASAGTSLVVAKPTGTVSGDLLLAVIAAASQTTITAPAGWTQVATQDAGANLRSRVYRRTAGGSEGSNYTWTLGASARNYGWIGCYEGFDPTDPVPEALAFTATSGSGFNPTDVEPVEEGTIVTAAVALRTASGSGTTWQATNISDGVERDDSTTNAGSGLDIAGAVYEGTSDATSVIASQSQTQVVVWSISLRPYFVPYDGGLVVPVVRAAFGADPDGDPDAWVWTDISDYVREDPGIVITRGRKTAHGQADPTRITLALANDDGRFSPFLATGENYPNIRRGVPLWVGVDNIGAYPPYERGTAFVDSWTPAWDESANVPIVAVEAMGRLARLSQDSDTVISPIRAEAVGSSALVGYWSMEDGAGSRRAAEVLGGPAASTSGVTFAADATLPGSSALPQLSATSLIAGRVPAYAAATEWAWVWMLKIPDDVIATTTLLEWATGGTIAWWRLQLVPGSPDTLQMEAYNSVGTQVLTSNTLSFNESKYGEWLCFDISAKQNGANIDWTYNWSQTGAGSGKVGTVNTQTMGNLTSWKIPAAASWEAGADKAAVGHLAAYADADAVAIVLMSLVMNGQDGERTIDRFTRMLDAAGVPYEYEMIPDYDALQIQTMGPQSRNPLWSNLIEVNDVELGLLHDGGALGAIKLHMRETRYNAAVRMALDCADSEVMPGFLPAYDSQQMANDVTVTRSGGSGDQGSSERQVDTAHVAAEGRYAPSPANVNVESDLQLPGQAGWRVRLGTAAGMRVPRLSLDFRAAPHLVQDWIYGGLNSRVTVDNLPVEFPERFADLFCEGIEERLSTVTWTADQDCSPAAPYAVFVVEDPVLGMFEPESCVTAEVLDTTETGIDIISSTLLATGAQVIELNVGGEKVVVSTVSGSSNPQTLTVTRSANGVIKGHAAGTPVRLWSRHVPAL